MFAEEQSFIVLDNGSGNIKIGLSDERCPSTLPSLYINKVYYTKNTGKFIKKEWIERSKAKEILWNLFYPVEHGLFLHNMDYMETMWSHTFKELQLKPKDSPVVIAEPVIVPKVHKEKLAEVMFESIGVPAVCMQKQNILSILGTGTTSGLALECGEGVTSVVSIIEGYPHLAGVIQLDMGGREIVDHLARTIGIPPSPLLHPMKQHTFPPVSRREVIREVMEKYCFVAEDFQGSLEVASKAGPKAHYRSTSEQRDFETPDGQILSVGHERFCAPECLFSPSLLGNGFEGPETCPGVHEMVFRALLKCPRDQWPLLAKHIVVSGGCTLFPGFMNRMQNEMCTLCEKLNEPVKDGNLKLNESMKLSAEVGRTKNPLTASWVGGAILASLSTCSPREFVWKEEYEENGPGILWKKFW